jgi:FkbM family methyltransferase
MMALIYDVGMNNGDDTAYYLSKGYSVIAIEASSPLVQSGQKRFRREVDTGQLTILELAIAEQAGEDDFWICEGQSEWNSLKKELASREMKNHYSVRVQTARFRDILSHHERPYYVKIDIEGSDFLCLRDLDDSNSPRFVSAESECSEGAVVLNEAQYLATIRLMREKGYDKFKLLTQSLLVPVTRSSLDLYFSRAYRAEMRAEIERNCNWLFPASSSGPFGDDIPGPWMEFSEAVELYREFRDRFFRAYQSAPLYSFWCDWHASRA